MKLWSFGQNGGGFYPLNSKLMLFWGGISTVEAQALATSIWDHGGHGVTQVNKNEGNKSHLLQFCPYLQGKHEI